MTNLETTIDHEDVVVHRGERTGLPIIIGVHSTLLGPALGGLRITRYRTPLDALADALRLSRAMTFKAASVDNGTGGGKSVVPLLPDGPQALEGQVRTSLLLDVADVVHSLDGRYIVAPDVGTGPADMAVMRARTGFVGGYTTVGATPGTTYGTARGLERAILVTARQAWGSDDLAGRRVVVLGYGGVGRGLATALIERGATVLTTDIDPSLRAMAQGAGATWIDLETVFEVEADLLSPCALGGVITPEVVSHLRCRAIVGGANNQLSVDAVADALQARGILWAPDFVANAGGILYAAGREMLGLSHEDAERRLDSISETLERVFESSERDGTTTLAAAYRIAADRLSEASSLRRAGRGA